MLKTVLEATQLPNKWLAHGAPITTMMVLELDASESVVFAGMLAQGVTSTTLGALTTASNIHVHETHGSEAARRVCAGLTAIAQQKKACARFETFHCGEGEAKIFHQSREQRNDQSAKGHDAQAQQAGKLLFTKRS